MKRFKPFTPPFFKKEDRCCYWYQKMSELAEINGETVDLKEKYGRMNATLSGNAGELLEETMEDYEALSEESCMYCNRHCKQHWTHEDSWVIHLCLPCLIGDKVTVFLEKIIRWWNRQDECIKWLQTFLLLAMIAFYVRIYIEVYILYVS